MTTRRNALFLTLTATLLPLSLTAQAQKSDEQAIRAAYAKSDVLFRKKDLTNLMKMLTPDIIYKEADGTKVDRKGMETSLQSQFAAIQSIDSFKTTVKKIAVKGSTAQAETTMSMTGKAKDNKGKVHTMSAVSTTRDTWTKTPQGWRIKQVETLSDKSTLDGKPLGR